MEVELHEVLPLIGQWLMDTVTPAKRSEVMGRVKGKDTSLEMKVRSAIHRMGFRYRLHAKELPGRPDIVFRPRRKVIFVHGCFWHRHEGCKLARIPKSRVEFWEKKLTANKVRDRSNIDQLRRDGWAVLVIWECETRDMERVCSRIEKFLTKGQKTNA